VPVWSLSLDNNWGEQAQPIVYNGVMYVTNARHTVAIDVGTGKQLWKHTLEWPADTPRVVCCGVSNKGAAIYNGRIYRTTLDAHVLALDARDGKEIWKTKIAEWTDGVSLTLAPLIANGVLVIGNSGAEFGVRGFIDHRSGHRQAPVAALYDPGARREGQRDLAARHQCLGDRRRLGLDHRLL
jgi:alcohol dehydrogenase (cytochrome c)